MQNFTSLNQWVLDNLRLEQAENNFILDLTIFITHLGDGLTLIVIALCLLGTFTFTKHYKVSALWFVTVAMSFGISGVLKHSFDEARPDEIYHLIHAASPAFPSGHALRSTVVYILGAILILRVFGIRSGRRYIFFAVAALPILIGYSRLLLGVHWFTDVLAGWAIGLVICGVSYAVMAKLPNGKGKQ